MRGFKCKTVEEHGKGERGKEGEKKKKEKEIDVDDEGNVEEGNRSKRNR